MAAEDGGGGRFLLAAMAMLVVSCGGGANKAAAPITPATTIATTTTTVDPKQPVIAAYENYIKQFSRVTGDPSGRPDDPILLSTVTPQFAKQVELNVFGLRSLHRYTKGDVNVVQANFKVKF